MTATDPRPEPAAKPAARLAPADAPDEPAAKTPDAEDGDEGRLIECHVGERVFVGLPDTPEFEAWRERQRQREEREKEEAAACAHDTS